MAAVKRDGKSAFVRDLLTKNSDANAAAINAAWKEAGQDGTISESLVHKVRAGIKLTGNAKSQKPTTGANGAAKRAKAGSSTGGQQRSGATKAGGRAKGTNGAQTASAQVRQPKAASRGDAGLLDELEATSTA